MLPRRGVVDLCTHTHIGRTIWDDAQIEVYRLTLLNSWWHSSSIELGIWLCPPPPLASFPTCWFLFAFIRFSFLELYFRCLLFLFHFLRDTINVLSFFYMYRAPFSPLDNRISPLQLNKCAFLIGYELLLLLVIYLFTLASLYIIPLFSIWFRFLPFRGYIIIQAPARTTWAALNSNQPSNRAVFFSRFHVGAFCLSPFLFFSLKKKKKNILFVITKRSLAGEMLLASPHLQGRCACSWERWGRIQQQQQQQQEAMNLHSCMNVISTLFCK